MLELLYIGILMAGFFWFHAFRRNDVRSTIDVLLDGVQPTPPTLSSTRSNETILGLPPSVYFYLGHFLGNFGSAGFVFAASHLDGEFSPFDTGGLVGRIQPVCTWSNEDKAQYRKQYSWPTSELDSKVAQYPGSGVAAYLDCSRPTEKGPHVHWEGSLQADIWSNPANSPQTWTYEGRRSAWSPGSDAIQFWTCEPDLYTRITSYVIDENYRTAEVEELLPRYVRGGASALQVHMRTIQVS